MKKLLVLLVVLFMVAGAVSALAAPPFDRKITWTQNRMATDNVTAIPATDTLLTHLFHCSALFDNTSCAEIGVSAANATSAVVTSPQKPNSTAWYKARVEWLEQSTLSDFSPLFEFFLEGWRAQPPRIEAITKP